MQRSDVIFLLIREVGNLWWCAENVRCLALTDPIKGVGFQGCVPRSNFFDFHAVFPKKIGHTIGRLHPPGLAHPSGKCWIRNPLYNVSFPCVRISTYITEFDKDYVQVECTYFMRLVQIFWTCRTFLIEAFFSEENLPCYLEISS